MIGIKGMEMPSRCRECEYTPKDCSYCLRLHQPIQRNIFDTSRHPNCPLVEIEERKVGKWIPIWDLDHIVVLAYQCSECETMRNQKTNYCANCGAEMRGAEND